MRPLYENVQDDLEIYLRSTGHISPHVHKSMECVYVSEGTLELGNGLGDGVAVDDGAAKFVPVIGWVGQCFTEFVVLGTCW